ncbi:MAG: hypothetical protein AAF333_10355 [Planctomycetota bacterium]
MFSTIPDHNPDTHSTLPTLALLAVGFTVGLASSFTRGLPLGTGFESVTPGSTAVSGDIKTTDGIDLVFSDFQLSGGGTTSNFGTVVAHGLIPPASGFGDGKLEAQLNNIFMNFDFGADPTLVEFDYAFLGGDTNLQVNGAIDAAPGGLSQILGVALTPVLQTFNGTYNGIDFELTGQLTGGNNEIGRLTLGDGVAPITKLGVGGQEFGVDRIRAVPEPAGAASLSLMGFAMHKRRQNYSGPTPNVN